MGGKEGEGKGTGKGRGRERRGKGGERKGREEKDPTAFWEKSNPECKTSVKK